MRNKSLLSTGLPIVAICFFLSVVGPHGVHAEDDRESTNNNTPPTSLLDEVLEKHIVHVVNDYRVDQSLPPLTEDENLTKDARKYAKGAAAGTLLPAHAVWQLRFAEIVRQNPFIYEVAENCAHMWPDVDLAGKTLQLWISSQRHNRNLVHEWNLTGVGVSMDVEGDVYICQLFARGKRYDEKDAKDIDSKSMQ